MLMMTFPLMLLLMISPKWNYSMLYMSMMTLIITPSLTVNFLPINLTNTWALDHMSIMLITLTLWIMPMVIAASQNIKKNALFPDRFLLFLFLLTLILLASFSASHLFLFYILFEASLIPTLLIIMKWGYQPERLQASMYLILYTVTASLPLLAGISVLYSSSPCNPMFLALTPHNNCANSLWLLMNLAFMVKLPLFFFHLWLPKAHVEAPVAGSMILAAILLKLGGYGMLRVMYMIPPVFNNMKFLMISLALWGGMITSFICVRQQDMKLLIAYSSVGHMSLVMAGILSGNAWGAWGAIAMMIAHGLLSSSLFAAADITYNMSNSRSLIMNKGLNISIPSMSMLWFIMSAANMAAPPSCNLMAEILLITAAAISSKIMLIPLGLMSFTAAAYSLTLYIAMNHGPMNPMSNPSMSTVPRNLFIILNHCAPVVLIMLMPTLITMW